jgi:hypothetical protein
LSSTNHSPVRRLIRNQFPAAARLFTPHLALAQSEPATTTNPTDAWVWEQTREYLQHAGVEKPPVKLLFHDNDSKFTRSFGRNFARRRIVVRKTAFRASNTNAYVERFIQTIQQECLAFCKGRRRVVAIGVW